MIAEIIISTMCLAANGIPPKVFNSTHVFTVPPACVAVRPFDCRGPKADCSIYSDGSYKTCGSCNCCTCGPRGGCMCTLVYCPVPAWWEQQQGINTDVFDRWIEAVE